ncbi:hypothetical protein BHU72_10070 [Desulfuribacillus stibiiarsenatis]|uniref:histidine kinase n=1 Tax=Desulfuribacillus stibiiarsenatis TaxID=1390249 RepID=A0A1E5L8W3_9FIRM|nr:ATP-binding protein [Desulfuribacillus stibiiarsenatis]OEH86597.1 hypothetical protein BHU72_10070 [Desulfuribacillus stibiiarsenatis]
MLHRISVKLSIIFSILLLIIVTGVVFITHSLFNTFFIEYVTDELMHRGHGHAEVLAEHYNIHTLEHVASMERDAITDVIVVDKNGRVLIASEAVTEDQYIYVQPLGHARIHHQEAIEIDWRNKPYIVTRSPIIKNNELFGAVYMFTPTKPIRDAVTFQFKIVVAVWLISGLIGVLLIYLLSRVITRPLLEMKNATESISKGSFDIEIKPKGGDELAELGQAINAMAKNLNHYETSRHEFLSDIAHELRTPLTYLKGYSELLVKNEVKDQEEIQQFHQIIYDESKRVQRLVQDLLTLSKMDEPSFNIVKYRIDLVELINSVYGKLAPIYAEKEVTLCFQHEEEKCNINLDGERMSQVIVNLLDNALRYTAPGGFVQIALKQSMTHTTVTVSDSGSGIREDDIPFIWQRLYRAEKSRSRDTGGSGLGLAIVKKIIELHKGEISVSSKEGQGTTFEIQLPNE